MIASVAPPRSIQIRQIVARASTLYERLNEQQFRSTTDAPSEEALEAAKERLQEWLQAAAKGNEAEFQSLLDRNGLTLPDVMRSLAPLELRENAPLPEWANTLEAVLDIAAELSKTPFKLSHYSFLLPEEPIAFEELFVPFVLFARRELAKRVNVGHRLSETAQATLERTLLLRLAHYFVPFQNAFIAWRSLHQSSFGRLLTRSQSGSQNNSQNSSQNSSQNNSQTNSQVLYDSFVQRMLAGRLAKFFQEYAVMARLLSTLTNLWVTAHTEFVQHLEADWDVIQQELANGTPLGQVVGVRAPLSDPHRGGKWVIDLLIAPNLRLIYKPKHLGTERAYNRLIDALNQQGLPLPLKSLKVISRETHGWVEFVEEFPCQTEATVRRYYRRSGMLLCLIFVLEGTDCHHENLIGSGEHPVLIDTETLMQHRFQDEGEAASTAYQLAQAQFDQSVTRTGLLPVWRIGADGDSISDISGLINYSEPTTVSYLAPRWSFINSDRMVLEYERVTDQAVQKYHTINGQPIQLSDWIGEICGGFEQMYRHLIQYRSQLLSPGSPLQELGRQPIRFVFRSTEIYTTLLQKLTQPKYLREGVARSIALEALSRGILHNPQRDCLWGVLAAEKQAMEQMDVPFFHVCADRVALEDIPFPELDSPFQCPSIEQVEQRLRALNSSDLQAQIQIIQGSFYARLTTKASQGQAVTGSQSAPVSQPEESIPVLESRQFLAEAIAIGERLKQRAIYNSDKTLVWWIAPQIVPRKEVYQFKPLGFSVYDGQLGIAMFLAALSRVSGNEDDRAFSLLATKSVLQTVADTYHPALPSVRRVSLGIGDGLGGVIYSLVYIGQTLADDQVLQQALHLSDRVTADRVASDTSLDVMSGSAGAILGLLAAYRVMPEPRILEAAVCCGQHLLNSRVAGSQGLRAWATLDGKLMTGFSHGAAGIAYALLRLFQVTGEAEFCAAAEEAIAYEKSCFNPQFGNWADLREFSKLLHTDPADRFQSMSSWCHGATGIGLARLAGLAVYSPAAVCQDLETAIQTTQNWLLRSHQFVDQICCGNFGRVDFLVEMAGLLGRSELLTETQTAASLLIHRAKQEGYALLPALPRGVYNPGFFQGESGIGYTLLRLACPQQFPCILAGNPVP